MITFHHNSGFYLTTVTKGLLGGIVLSSIVFLIPLNNYRYWFNFNYTTIFEKHNVLKYLGCKCVFLDPKDLLCAAVLLYHFRIFERKYGSRKFASYALGIFIWTSLLELGCVYFLHKLGVNLDALPSGPYCLIFPWFVPYYCDIPRVTVSHIFGVFPITGKSLNYIIGLQMAAGSPESLLLALCGIVAGVIYRQNLLWSQRIFAVPNCVGKFLDKTLSSLIESKTAIGSQLPMGATLEIQRQQRVEQLEQQLAWAQFQQRPGNRNGLFGGLFGNRNVRNRQQQNAHVVRNRQPMNGNNIQAERAAPTEDNVNQLIEMGFNRESVISALTMTNNDISLATNVLLQES